MEPQQLIITTSWDDGHPLDLKLAALLDKYNIKGTFYIPLKNTEHKVMNNLSIQDIASHFEIGGHTVNHMYLDTLKDKNAWYEISTCKSLLQELVAKPITSFCFPGGKYTLRDIEFVLNAGFLFSRTTAFFHDSIDNTSSLINTTMQVYNHSRLDLLIHCLKRANIAPILRNNFFIPYNRKFYTLANKLLLQAYKKNGVFHLWGHSWEIEEYGLWTELEKTLRMLKSIDNAVFMDNTECWSYTGQKA